MEGDKKPKRGKPRNRGINRRDALKMGAAAGAVTVLTSRKSAAAAFVPFQINTPTPPPPPPEPAICATFTGSSATHPFVQKLPIPPALKSTTLNPSPIQSANTAAGQAPLADHQRWNEFLPQ